MSDKKSKKPQKLKARLPRGFTDRTASDIRATDEMVAKIRAVFERYGFDPVETPAFEYTDALGKFLPDQDRPNEGVFSLQDDDEQWMSLRYDLTAPLARLVEAADDLAGLEQAASGGGDPSPVAVVHEYGGDPAAGGPGHRGDEGEHPQVGDVAMAPGLGRVGTTAVQEQRDRARAWADADPALPDR